MAKFKKNMVISERNYSGSGLCSKVSFSGKLYLAIFLLLAGLFVQFSIVISHLYEYRNDLKNIAMTRRIHDDFVYDLHDFARDILRKVYSVRGSKNAVDISNDLTKIHQILHDFSDSTESNVFSNVINNIKMIIDTFNEKESLINDENYRTAESIYKQITTVIIEVEELLLKYNQNNYQETMVILVIKLIIILLTFFIEILICKWLVKCAIRSIDEPADRIIRVLRGSNGDLKVKIPIFSSEGLGASGLLLNSGISKWHELALEFKSASNKLNYLVEELISNFNQVFLFEAQLKGAYGEVENSLEEQKRMGEKVDQEIKMIMLKLSQLEFLPKKISKIWEDLNNLLTVNRENLNGLINRQIETDKKPHSIVDYLKDLSATSERVDRIMSELEEIETGSEMLAYNSAISAARAGKEGQGFGVVAKEIAYLVERSKMASHNLNSLIRQIQVKTEQIVNLAPEKDFFEEERFSLDRTINKICSNLGETAANCLNEIDLMRQGVQIIFEKSNDTFEKISTIPDLTFSGTDELGKIKDIIGRYLESLKHTGEISSRICETVNKLQSATNMLIH